MTAAFLAILALVGLVCVSSVQLDIKAKDVECMGDEIMVDELAIAEFQSLLSKSPSGEALELTMSLRGPNEQVIYRKKGLSTRYAFTGKEEGHHTLCLVNANDVSVRAEVGLRSGVEAEDYDAVAKKEHLDSTELMLRKIADTLDEAYGEMQTLREKEALRRDLNEATNEYVLYFSMLSTTVVLCVALWQVYHLKRYLESKKLL
mmetsp:Transcript_22177/g.71351  ORF Transcript_22177/g.71351 Transcript_22177/m.71351 type:complete len:204 (+) Transcript_22177:1-612(+)